MNTNVVSASALWAFLAACCAAPANEGPNDAAITEHRPCESPEQPGCAECCVEQWGPAEDDRICNRRTAAESGRRDGGRDYAERASILRAGPCPATCRPCAPCTRDRMKSYERLRSKRCDCLDPFVRDVARGIDPCFSDGCGCVCTQLGQLSECGPPR